MLILKIMQLTKRRPWTLPVRTCGGKLSPERRRGGSGNTKCKANDVTETSYSIPPYKSTFLAVHTDEWETVSAYEIFMRQLPQDELANWAEWTSEALLADKKKPTDAKEMGLFLGCMIAQTRSSKVGGVGRSFATLSDGLFPPQDLGRFGMGHKRYKEIYSNWRVAKEIKEGPKKTDTSDFYWPTDQLIDRLLQ